MTGHLMAVGIEIRSPCELYYCRCLEQIRNLALESYITLAVEIIMFLIVAGVTL